MVAGQERRLQSMPVLAATSVSEWLAGSVMMVGLLVQLKMAATVRRLTGAPELSRLHRAETARQRASS
jgi:hypothetical protein